MNNVIVMGCDNTDQRARGRIRIRKWWHWHNRWMAHMCRSDKSTLALVLDGHSFTAEPHHHGATQGC